MTTGLPPHLPEWEQAVAEALGEREVPRIEPKSMEANDEMEFNQPEKVCDMTNVNCTQYFNGKCLHQAAPRRVMGAAKCILIHPVSTDFRVPPGCLLQQERSRSRSMEKK